MRPRSVLVAIAIYAAALGVPAPSATSSRAVDVGHRLSIAVPAQWHVSHRRLTPCTNPIERFSLIRGNQMLMLQERLHPARAELSGRPKHFHVHGMPSQLECCSVPGRRGWVLQFSDHGRAFYAYLYAEATNVDTLLRMLETLRVGGEPPTRGR